MSQYITKLRETPDEQGQTGRDGIEWPNPVGTWKQNENVNRLETFANNLDVSQAPGDTDLLNSVPTPWARLLLFESALYKAKHPSHSDIEDQWRGLLGVLALAEPLRLKVGIKALRIADFQSSKIGRTFADLRPHYLVGKQDEEEDKWNEFQMILVDNVVVGATSPRTLVFTGIAHQCPRSVPFRTLQGRLTDPVAYYKRFNDTHYLGMLAYWLNGLIAGLGNNQQLTAWLGTVPAAPGAAPGNRMSLLLERLKAWQRQLQGVQAENVTGKPVARFTLAPYSAVNGLPSVAGSGTSDLLLRGTRDVIVCYHPEPTRDGHSNLLNANEQEVMNEPIKIYDGRWIQSNQPLPLPFNFLPPGFKVIENPAALFEDALIQINLPENSDAIHYLKIGDERGSKSYLFPFKPEIMRYLNTQQLADNTKVSINQQTNKARVELNIPLENNRIVKAVREYDPDAGAVINNALTSGLSVWPDFTSPTWNRYFYLKTSVKAQEVVDFEPAVKSVSRSKETFTWYTTEQPVAAFIGSVNGKKGLLLLRNASIDPPETFWKVGIDFGSTHTRAFALQVDKRGEEFVPSPGATIKPIKFSTRARPLTYNSPFALKDNFFGVIGEVDPPEREELKTLLMMPETNPGNVEGWLPREGYVYLHWILDGYDETHLRSDLKWNSHRDDPDLRAFLRCLLVMIQAEAMKQAPGARVVSISHTYPSVFTAGLVAKHNAEWKDLEQYMNPGGLDPNAKLDVQEATLTETVAVCRHLEWEQHASPVDNTISLDVGGSTTDMAVWANKKLKVQESVKMAAGLVGRYLQSSDAQEFLNWLETTLHGAPYNSRNFSLATFSKKRSGYSLMFNNLLSVIDLNNHLGVLVRQINGAKESRRVMSHIIYLYGSLLYYAGLLARKAGLPQAHNTYHIYFCGKGGTLVEWIQGYKILAQQMFEAGLFGPAGPGQNSPPVVDVKISEMPKQEVGRGLLAESYLEGRPGGKDEGIGLVDPNPPSVTVGDTGYQGLQWDGELSPQSLLQLPDNVVPPMKDLQELNKFIETFKSATATKAAAAVLGLDQVDASEFQNHLLQRLFGSIKGSVISDIRRNDKDALLEPLFITEVKVLLETATKNADLFA